MAYEAASERYSDMQYRVCGKSAEVTLEDPHPEFEPELSDDQVDQVCAALRAL